MSMDSSNVAADAISGIADLTIEQLRLAWTDRFNAPPPRLRSRDLLARAFTYRLQVHQHGDLTVATRRRIAELGRRFTEDPAFKPSSGPDLKPGSTLVREWGGARHEVQVLESGFAYAGETFNSLSQVATRIAGVRWNGLVFFGLKPRKAPAARHD